MIRTPKGSEYHKRINKFLGRDITESPGLNFAEFYEFLLSVNITRCDIHYRQQAHELETSGLISVDHIIHLENLEEELLPLVSRYDLLPASVPHLSQSVHNSARSRARNFMGYTPLVRTVEDVYPEYENFYDEELSRKVRRSYQVDFERYGYSDSLL